MMNPYSCAPGTRSTGSDVLHKTRRALRLAVALSAVLMVFVTFGCNHAMTDEAMVTKYLKTMGWTAEAAKGSSTMAKFPVDIPADWTVGQGPFPTRLYWTIADTLSKDVGLGLESCHGQEVVAFVVPLAKKPWPNWVQGQRRNLAIMLVKDHRVVGAWLELEGILLGPSLKGRNLTDITGLDWGESGNP